MVDSTTVLWGQTLAYTFYVLAIMAVMGWFALRITQQGPTPTVKPGLFYAFVAFLVVLGVSLHFITYYTIPWKPMDMNRAEITPDKVFDIGVADHKFEMPAERLQVACNDKVLFNVTSRDLTYGFGLFRSDHSLLFQMQVVPGTSTTSCGSSTGPASTRSGRRSTPARPVSTWWSRTPSWCRATRVDRPR